MIKVESQNFPKLDIEPNGGIRSPIPFCKLKNLYLCDNGFLVRQSENRSVVYYWQADKLEQENCQNCPTFTENQKNYQ